MKQSIYFLLAVVVLIIIGAFFFISHPIKEVSVSKESAESAFPPGVFKTLDIYRVNVLTNAVTPLVSQTDPRVFVNVPDTRWSNLSGTGVMITAQLARKRLVNNRFYALPLVTDGTKTTYLSVKKANALEVTMSLIAETSSLTDRTQVPMVPIALAQAVPSRGVPGLYHPFSLVPCDDSANGLDCIFPTQAELDAIIASLPSELRPSAGGGPIGPLPPPAPVGGGGGGNPLGPATFPRLTPGLGGPDILIGDLPRPVLNRRKWANFILLASDIGNFALEHGVQIGFTSLTGGHGFSVGVGVYP